MQMKKQKRVKETSQMWSLLVPCKAGKPKKYSNEYFPDPTASSSVTTDSADSHCAKTISVDSYKPVWVAPPPPPPFFFFLIVTGGIHIWSSLRPEKNRRINKQIRKTGTFHLYSSEHRHCAWWQHVCSRTESRTDTKTCKKKKKMKSKINK